MLGIYFSGTGNTKHCIEKLVNLIENTAKILPLEEDGTVEEIKKNDTIILGYPTQFSNTPYFVRDFIKKHPSLWKGKKVFCVVTMGLFSGDGTGCAARPLKKQGAVILGGLHIKMPDSVCDVKHLKKTLQENKELVRQADKKLEIAADQIKRGRYPQDGITFLAHLAGLFGQRLWFYGKTNGYTDKLNIHESCISCGLCVSLCPMKNLTMQDDKVAAGANCTMCYRCISHCPQRAITLLGSEVNEQCQFEKYC